MNKQIFQTLEKNVQTIANSYFIACEAIKVSSSNIYSACFLVSQMDIVRNINFIFSLLDDVEKEIINNEFFFENYPFWWENIYPEKVFKKIKLSAMKNFIELFKESFLYV